MQQDIASATVGSTSYNNYATPDLLLKVDKLLVTVGRLNLRELGSVGKELFKNTLLHG